MRDEGREKMKNSRRSFENFPFGFPLVDCAKVGVALRARAATAQAEAEAEAEAETAVVRVP